MADIALSTMWMRGRFERPRDFLLAATEMGFRSFEITAVAGPAFCDHIHPGEFDIPSFHDPAPGDVEPSALRINDIVYTSLDEERRKLAVETAKRSIDIAVRYGARALVLHAGHSDVDPQLEGRLEQIFAAGDMADAAAAKIRQTIAEQRQTNFEEHMAALMRSLDDLIPYAGARGIQLGLENRRHIHEIPNFEEMERLLSFYADPTLAYWHDCGHAEALARLGMTRHADWLCAFGERLAGIHLHDVIGLADHRAPGSGCVDWEGLAQLVPSHGLRTAEIKPDAEEDEIWASVAHLAASGWIHE